MIPHNMRDLVTQRNNAIVAINRPSGSPHLSPVWYVWDGDAFWFRIARSTAKYRNLLRDPAISLFFTDPSGVRYLAVSGQAEVLEHDDVAIAAQLAEKYYAPPLAQLRQLPRAEEPDVVTIRVHPKNVVAVVEEIAQEAANSWSAST